MTNWIKCSERMPSPGDTVIVVSPVFKDVLTAMLSGDGERWYPVGEDDMVPTEYTTFDGSKQAYYTHWMPLPEPPSKEE